MQAIILQRRDFREHDQIVSLYTKEKGKLELLARGVKKTISKNAAHLEPFCFVMIEMVPGKEIDHLTKVVPMEMFVQTRSGLRKSIAAGYAMSLLSKMIHVEEPDSRIWNATLSWLRFIQKEKGFSPLLLDGFVINILGYLGFAPELSQCVVCDKTFHDIAKEQLTERKTAGLYFAGGGLICPECLVEKKRVGEEIATCGLKEISDMQILLKGDWGLVQKMNLDQQEMQQVHRLVYEFALYHSEKKLADWDGLLAQ